ncbi:MAG: cell division protein FtsA [Bacteroidales bacterium]
MSKVYTAAIDIGSSKIRVAVAKLNERGEVQLLGYAEEASNGVINSEALHLKNVADSVQRAVLRIEERLDGKISKAFVNVGGRKFITKYFKFHKLVGETGVISEHDVKHLENEVRNVNIPSELMIYDVCAVKYTVDAEKCVKDPVHMAGRKLEAEYAVIVGPKDYSRYIQKVFDDIQIEILKLSVDAITTSKLFLTKEEMEEGAILLDMGKGTTKCTVYVDGRIKLMHTVPFGGDTVTKDIKQGLNISYDNAEKLKVESANVHSETTEEDKFISVAPGGGWKPREISVKNLSSIVSARLEEIMEFINDKFMELNIHENIGAGVVIVGGGARLHGISELITYCLALSVKYGTPNFKAEPQTLKIFSHPLCASLAGLVALKLGLTGNGGNPEINSDDDIEVKSNASKGLLMRFVDKFFD